jgi:hypothetical protein
VSRSTAKALPESTAQKSIFLIVAGLPSAIEKGRPAKRLKGTFRSPNLCAGCPKIFDFDFGCLKQ